MRVLVTGSCGFVGSTFVRELRKARPDLDMVGIDNFIREGSRGNRGPLEALGVRIVEGDVRDPAALERAGDVDWVLDCAAEPSVLAGVGGSTTSFEVLDHNLVGTIRVLEYCKRNDAGLILVSTSRVYSIAPLSRLPVTRVDGAYRPDFSSGPDGLGAEGIAERFPTDPPLSLYGVSKRCSEHLAIEYAEAYDLPVFVNRCGVLAGRGQFGKADQGIFSFWIRSWLSGRPLSYVGFDGMGSQVRDCLHPRDLVPVILAQMDGRQPADPRDGVDRRICNFAGGLANAISLWQLSRWCEEHVGPRDVGATLQGRPYDLPWIVLDCRRAMSMWGWKMTTPLESILSEIAAEAAEIAPLRSL